MMRGTCFINGQSCRFAQYAMVPGQTGRHCIVQKLVPYHTVLLKRLLSSPNLAQTGQRPFKNNYIPRDIWVPPKTTKKCLTITHLHFSVLSSVKFGSLEHMIPCRRGILKIHIGQIQGGGQQVKVQKLS